MKMSRGLLSISTLAACLFVLAGIAAAQQPPRGVTPEDYFSFEFISDPNISPDGKLVAYVLTGLTPAEHPAASMHAAHTKRKEPICVSN